MKFMLMMHAPRGTGEYQISGWKPEEFRAHIQFMKDLNKGLREAGELASRAPARTVGEDRDRPVPLRGRGGEDREHPGAELLLLKIARLRSN
jgi:hypothetical protein